MLVPHLAREIVGLLQRLPADRLVHPVLFQRAQIVRFKKAAGMELTPEEQAVPKKRIVEIVKEITFKEQPQEVVEEVMTEEGCRRQLASLKRLLANEAGDKYKAGEVLLRPQGNPEYYERLVRELDGEGNETLGSAIRVVMRGK